MGRNTEDFGNLLGTHKEGEELDLDRLQEVFEWLPAEMKNRQKIIVNNLQHHLKILKQKSFKTIKFMS